MVAGQDRRDTGSTGLAPLPRLGQQAIPQRRDMAQPAAEAPVVAQQPRSMIASDPSSFDRQGSGTAQRVQQGAARGGDGEPIGFQQQCGSQGFLQWRDHAGLAVTAPVQAVAGQVEADDSLVVPQLNMNAQIRSLAVDAGSAAALRPKAVDDGVLDPLSAVMAVIDTGAYATEFDAERAVWSQVLFPGQGMDAAV